MGLSIRAYARHRGVSHVAVKKAIDSGRITPEADGTLDPQRAGGEDSERARAVPDHLRRVANHPGIDPLVRETCAQLAYKLENRGGHDGRAEPGLVMPSNRVH
jgi:hypothetical protein